MKAVWPHAYLPRKERKVFIITLAVGVVGGLLLAVALHHWSWVLALAGVFLMMASSVLVARRYLRQSKKWYDDAVWAILLIAPMYRFFKLLKSGEEVPSAGLIGIGIFAVWTLFQAFMASFLWQTAGSEGEGELPKPSMSG